MLDPFVDDIAVRVEHVQDGPPELDIRPFALPPSPVEVWRSADGSVVVDAVGVHHEPVREAVAYRITTPSGVVVISGDTRVCDEVRDLAAGADVLVHEACRASAMKPLTEGTPFEQHLRLPRRHGGARRAGPTLDIGHLVLTHLIPPPTNPAEEQAFAADVREGGYTGALTVGHDLWSVDLT